MFGLLGVLQEKQGLIGKAGAGSADIGQRRLRLIAQDAQLAVNLLQGIRQTRNGAFGDVGRLIVRIAEFIEQIDELRALVFIRGGQSAVLFA